MEAPDQRHDAVVGDGRAANGVRGEEEDERWERSEQVAVGGEDVLAVEYGRAFGVDLFAGAQDVGAEARCAACVLGDGVVEPAAFGDVLEEERCARFGCGVLGVDSGVGSGVDRLVSQGPFGEGLCGFG